ncbi:MAG TPA: neutral/alkaline non-lysosomal ceramidase N-terminal domain-containing protein [Lacipirellulaceae bacterium]|nr:neutral/alkaline non-lysosomal ceramidase N-terminal domain-containing protein [Lacipirellulaceae bacterium]
MLRTFIICVLCPTVAAPAIADEAEFNVGFAKRDITPQAATPMWGYGARHAMLSQGTADPLIAKVVVIEAGDERLAIVGMDIGRGPTAAMMEQIRKAVAEKAGVGHVMIAGSHTHHGPVIELTDRDGFGKGKFDDAVAYSKRLPELLIEAIVEAKRSAVPARIGVAKKNVELNRNRHTKRTPKPTDPMLAVIRFDDAAGKPIAVIANFAAHPVTIETMILKFSADYPGALQNRVEASMKTNCVFMPGASGDMSPNRGSLDGNQYGEALGDVVIALAHSIETKTPERPSIQAKVDRFKFASRVDFNNPLLLIMFERAFFPELVRNYAQEFRDGIEPELATVLVNRNLALVGGSGEFFCNHANRLKERSYVDDTLFFGYCNGHHMYFPTIEAASEGGYGGDAPVAPAEIGAGEQMMNRALINIYTMLGKFPPETIE